MGNAALDIREYLTNKGLHLRQAPGYEYRMPCFFCEESGKKSRLYVNCDPSADIPGLFLCHHCGEHGALNRILRHFGDYKEPEQVADDDYTIKYEVLQAAAAYYHDQLTSSDNPNSVDVVRWLVSERGLEPDTIAEHQLGYADGNLRRHLRSLGFSLKAIQSTGLVDSLGQDFFEKGVVTIPYHTAGNVVWIRGKVIGGKYLGPPGQKGRLFNSDVTWSAKEELYITAGEFDSLVLNQLGFKAVGGRGENYWLPSWTAYTADVRRVYIVFDNDAAGVPAAEKLKQTLGVKTRIIKMPPVGLDGEKNDPSEWIAKKGHSKEDFLELVKAADSTSSPFIKASNVKVRPLNFYWNNRLPVGKLTIMAGIGGSGKSFCTLALAASITNGMPLLDDGDQLLDGEVLMLSYEDDLEDTLVPRAERLGVDLDRLHLLPPTIKTLDGERPFGPLDVKEYIEGPLLSNPNIRMVVIDPIGSFYGGGIDGNMENAVRGALSSLVEVAAKTKTIVLTVAHHRKGGNGPALHMIAGSQAAGALARSTLTVGEMEGIGVIAHTKHNLSAGAPSLTYTVEDGVFRWGGLASHISADQLVKAMGATPDTKIIKRVVREGFVLPESVSTVGDILQYLTQHGTPISDLPTKLKEQLDEWAVSYPDVTYETAIELINYCWHRKVRPKTWKGFMKYVYEAQKDGWISLKKSPKPGLDW